MRTRERRQRSTQSSNGPTRRRRNFPRRRRSPQSRTSATVQHGVENAAEDVNRAPYRGDHWVRQAPEEQAKEKLWVALQHVLDEGWSQAQQQQQQGQHGGYRQEAGRKHASIPIHTHRERPALASAKKGECIPTGNGF
eukprot:GHVU01198511.1.p1 GENE.GHVU01198511.1~~GHVU01198511.1.p1  ORF type:complete len:138 (-),score=12.51 GHVU01198511.1:196-609(-)